MAIERDQLTIGVELDSKGAIKNLDELKKGIKGVGKTSKESSKGVSSFDKALDNAFKSVTLLNQGVQLAVTAYNSLNNTLKTVTDAYSKQENAQRGLINTLKLQGQFSQAAINDFTEFATQLQKTSVVGDEVTLSFLKQAKAMGLSNEQSKAAVKAAANLSAATGRDLNSAFAQTLKTFGGFAGELGEVIPELKDLTAEQLKAGKAADLLNEKFRGEAEALTELFSGSAIQRANAFGDVLEEIGATFIETFDLNQVNKDAKVFFESLGKSVKSFREALGRIDFDRINENLKNVGMTLSTIILPVLIKMAIPLALVAAKFIAIGVAVGVVAVAIDIIARNLGNLSKVGSLALEVLNTAWLNFQITVIKGWELIFKGAQGLLGFLSKINSSFAKVAKGLSKSIDGVVDTLEKNLKVQIQKSAVAANDLGEAFKDLDDTGALGAIIDTITEIKRGFEAGVKPQVEAVSKGIGDVNRKLKETIELTKKELLELKKLKAENLSIAQEIEFQGKSQGELGLLKLQLALDEIDARKEGLDLGSKITNNLAREILDQQKNLTILRFQGDTLVKQKQVFGEITSEVITAKNQYKELLGIIKTPTDPALIDFKEKSEQLDKLVNKLKLTGVVITDVNKLMVLPNMDAARANKIVANSQAILTEIEKLRDGFVRIAVASKETTVGEDFAKGLDGFLRKSSKEIDNLASNINTKLFFGAEKLDEWGWTDLADTLRGNMKAIPGFDLSVSPETQESIAGFVDGTISVFSGMYDSISAGWDIVASTVGAGMDFFSGAADFIIGFDQAGIDAMKDMPGKIAEGMTNIGPMIESIGTAFSEGVTAFLSNIGTLLESLGPIMQKFVSSIGDALMNLLTDLPGIIFKFMEAMQPAFTELIKRLPDLISKIFDAIPEIIDALLSMLPEMLTQIIDVLPELIEKIIKGVIGMMGKIIASLIDIFITKGGAVKIAVALVKAIVNLIPAIIDGIATGLKNALGSIFGGFKYPLPDLEPFKKSVEDFIETVQKGAGKVADEVFAVIDIPSVTAGKRGDDPPEVAIQKGLEKGGDKVVGGIFGALIAGSKTLLPIVKAVGELKRTFSVKGFQSFLSKILGGVLNILEPIMQGLTIFGDFIAGALEPLLTAISSVLNPLLEGIAMLPQTISEGFQTLMEFFTTALPAAISSALTGIINLVAIVGETIISAFDPIIEVFENLGGTVTDAFKDVTKLLDTNMSANVSEAFSPITEAFSSVAEPFNSLANALNAFAVDIPSVDLPKMDGAAIGSDIASALSSALGTLFEPLKTFANLYIDVINALKLPNVSVGGKVLGKRFSFTLIPEMDLIPGTIQKFAEGGLVGGLFDGTDNQLIGAQPGEFVLRRGAVSGIGEQTISEMNRTGQVPSSGGNVALNINEGAITIMQQPGESSQDMAEKIFEELKQRSINGETVIFASGIRAE
jgi:hypothetical protein